MKNLAWMMGGIGAISISIWFAGCSSGGGSTDGGTDSPASGDSGPAGCGTATTLATGQKGVGAITLSGSTAIWTTCPTCLGNLDGTGDIMKVATSGGTPSVLAPAEDTGGIIVANATDAYWASPTNGLIRTIPVAGGSASSIQQNVNAPQFLTIDSAFVYWMTSNAAVKAPLAGGARTKLATATGNVRNIGVNGAGVYWIDQGTSANTSDGNIFSVGLGGVDGGAPTNLASGQTPAWIAVDENNVYWPDLGVVGGPAQPAIMKVAASGGTPVVLATRTFIPGVITVDATNVYWVETDTAHASGFVMKMPIAGGTPTCIAPGPELAGGIAVDSTSVYWTGNSDSTVMKAPK